jgi:hypothetical protein
MRQSLKTAVVFWQVMEVPEGMTFFEKGPLLSAKERDLDLLLGRLQQLNEACNQVEACLEPRPPSMCTLMLLGAFQLLHRQCDLD